MKFPQRVTFTATLTIDTEGMDWEKAVENVSYALLNGDAAGGGLERPDPYTLHLVKVTSMEIVEEDK